MKCIDIPESPSSEYSMYTVAASLQVPNTVPPTRPFPFLWVNKRLPSKYACPVHPKNPNTPCPILCPVQRCVRCVQPPNDPKAHPSSLAPSFVLLRYRSQGASDGSLLINHQPRDLRRQNLHDPLRLQLALALEAPLCHLA